MKLLIFTVLALGVLLPATDAKNIRFLKHRRQLNRKIVGGRPALPGEVPFQLAIVDQWGQFCGASLVEINGIHIGVSAAHCVDPNDAGEIGLVAGVLNASDLSGMEQVQVVTKVVVHRDFGSSWFALWNDIALLFVPDLFNLTETVSTIPLPAEGQLTLNGSLTVSGWGDLEFQGDSPAHLQIVEIPVTDTQNCMALYGLQNDSVVCAGTDKGDLSPCHGDSGGPAISDDGFLAGIVSFGTGNHSGCQPKEN